MSSDAPTNLGNGPNSPGTGVTLPHGPQHSGHLVRPFPANWAQRFSAPAESSGSDSTLQSSDPAFENGGDSHFPLYNTPLPQYQPSRERDYDEMFRKMHDNAMTWKGFILQRLARARYAVEKHRMAAEIAERRQIIMVKSVGAAGAEVFEETNAQRRAEFEVESLLMKLHPYNVTSDSKHHGEANRDDMVDGKDVRGWPQQRVPPKDNPRSSSLGYSGIDEYRMPTTRLEDRDFDAPFKPLDERTPFPESRPPLPPFPVGDHRIAGLRRNRARSPPRTDGFLDQWVPRSPHVQSQASLTISQGMTPIGTVAAHNASSSSAAGAGHMANHHPRPLSPVPIDRGYRVTRYYVNTPSGTSTPKTRKHPLPMSGPSPTPPNPSMLSRKRKRSSVEVMEQEPTRHVSFIGDLPGPEGNSRF